MVQVSLDSREWSVHPHGRGDNINDIMNAAAAVGSPPRAWGQCSRDLIQPGDDRFTPTGVGTIFSATARCRRLTVHPHGRGDNSAADAGTSLKTGSPPRAWGQYETEAASLTEARFTPTGVGTMWSRGADLIPTSVHPHGRGDNRSPGRNCTRSIGSPPRAWGQ